MSNRETRKVNKDRQRVIITRKQQVEAIRMMKTQEIADKLASQIKSAVKEEVSTQLKAIRDTMFDLIDRVMNLEKTLALSAPPDEGLPAYACNKCGRCYNGLSCYHDGCDYAAIKVDDTNGQERAEAPEVSNDVEVVQGS